MAADLHERLENELSLLESMYPGQITYDSHKREVTHTHDGASLQLRLPDYYLENEMPEVLTAKTQAKADLRDQVRKEVLSNYIAGEEILDSIVLCFNEMIELTNTKQASPMRNHEAPSAARASTIIWLHHLLNTNKRKQALSPTSSDVSGVTKPGYPGVLVYSGSAQAVQQHVNDLKHLNWQAFQVRMESDEEWGFAHGTGVVEVESMKEVVAEIGESRKEEFMVAMRMK